MCDDDDDNNVEGDGCSVEAVIIISIKLLLRCVDSLLLVYYIYFSTFSYDYEKECKRKKEGNVKNLIYTFTVFLLFLSRHL